VRRAHRPDTIPPGLLGLVFGLAVSMPSLALAGEYTRDRHERIVAAHIGRVLSGVVGIRAEVKAEVTVRCGPKGVDVVTPEGDRENGTGFVIHPDGWMATNGHVVMAIQKPDEEHVTHFSMSLEGDETIQGFNFLIPIDSIHTLAKNIGLTPSTDSAFTKESDRAVEAFVEGRLQEAIAYAEAADKIVPGLIDVRRAIVRIRMLAGEKP
jgi:S1-C subfamily serine protease